MDNNIVSEGKCFFCKKTITQRGFNKHIGNHLIAMSNDSKGTKRYFHIKFKAAEMFLQLLVSDSITLDKLDSFIRKIWMECCGHLSAFTFNKNEIPMSSKLKTTIIPNTKLEYIYDFGSSTKLEVYVYNSYRIDLEEDILLISRNEPLQILCDVCHKEPALHICTVCTYEVASFFCEKCGEKHSEDCPDFDDYAKMPVVNSPRMGTCGYTGGEIDLERDGVFKLK